MNCLEAQPLLHPYVDGELDAASVVAVGRHLAECESCARRLHDVEELRREIAEAGLEFAPRPELARKVAVAAKRVSRGPLGWWIRPFAWGAGMAAVAAALVILALPAARVRGPAVQSEIVDAHIRSLMTPHLVDVPSSDHHTVKPWFQGKLNFSPEVPDLAAQGFVLAGGRVDVVDGAPAAAIVYRRRDHVINVFVSAGGGRDERPRASAARGYNLVDWTKGGLSYRAVSDLNSSELRTFAELLGSH